MEVFHVSGRTSTTVFVSHLVNTHARRTIHQVAISNAAQPPARQAGLPHPAADPLRVVLQPLPTSLLPAIDFRGDLANHDLVLVLVTEIEQGADGKRCQLIRPFIDLLLCNRVER